MPLGVWIFISVTKVKIHTLKLPVDKDQAKSCRSVFIKETTQSLVSR